MSDESPAQASTPVVGVVCAATSAAACAEARSVATDLGLGYGESGNEGFDFVLVRDDERWGLRDAREPRMQMLSVDLVQLARRLRSNVSKRQPLARAIGAKTRTVIDATAGLAQDAFMLALLGYEVIAIERSPIVALLVQDGLRRALAAPEVADKVGRLRLMIGDARTLMRELPQAEAIYIDPMFPPKRKASAAVRKEMRWLRSIAGEDADAGELLTQALRLARDRVVVKRPDDAEPLAGRPQASHGTKVVRYDVYRATGADRV